MASKVIFAMLKVLFESIVCWVLKFTVSVSLKEALNEASSPNECSTD